MPTLHTNGEFFSKYQELNADYDSRVFAAAQNTIAKLLESETTSERPGMLLGKVQSGKTRTFITSLSLAFDNGFDVAIVLTKNSRPLLEQTLKRLRSEFSYFIEDGEMEIYDIMQCPDTFSEFELESKLLFVAKKETNNLKRLINLFETDCPALAKKRVIIVDDEADNASIGYTRRRGLVEANRIAGQISDFRSILSRSSFLQVTATPYSLYLQPTEIEVANVLEFKPTRPTFTVSVPAGDGYVGGDIYFGEKARGDDDTLEKLIHCPVDHRELDRLKRRDGRSYKPEQLLVTDLYKGIREAVVGFIVGGCIQRINGIKAGLKAKKLRYSFLLHSEAAMGAHSWQEILTEELVARLTGAARNRGEVLEGLVAKAYGDFKVSLQLDGLPVPELSEVVDSVIEALTSGYVTISKINSENDVSALLDDTGQLKLRSPFCIFIGGQVLDRGVTLANMIGFYYGRRPQRYQQDTVLQHSRMYGYRRADLAVTRFYTSAFIRQAMFQMEDFDNSLREVIEAGGDGAVQFIKRAANGTIVPCSPNKILVATTQTLRPNKRLLPIGFQSGYATGRNGIRRAIEELDAQVEELCGFNRDAPVLVSVETAVELLEAIEPTLVFEDEDAPPFDWESAKAALHHLSQQHPDVKQRGQVLLWAATGRDSARLAAAGSHAKYIETPDSAKTEGVIAHNYAVDHPILFLLRQNGSDSADKGWRGTPFYWPVVRAQQNAPTVVYTAEVLD